MFEIAGAYGLSLFTIVRLVFELPSLGFCCGLVVTPFLLEKGDEPQLKLFREYLDILILVPPGVV